MYAGGEPEEIVTAAEGGIGKVRIKLRMSSKGGNYFPVTPKK